MEKLTWLKKTANVMVIVGLGITFLGYLVPVGRDYDSLYSIIMQTGAGIAFAGIALRIARFLYLW